MPGPNGDRLDRGNRADDWWTHNFGWDWSHPSVVNPTSLAAIRNERLRQRQGPQPPPPPAPSPAPTPTPTPTPSPGFAAPSPPAPAQTVASFASAPSPAPEFVPNLDPAPWVPPGLDMGGGFKRRTLGDLARGWRF